MMIQRLFPSAFFGALFIGLILLLCAGDTGVGLVSAETRVRSIQFDPQTVTQWSPFLEWQLNNSSYSGNPYDLIATATFTHTATGETRTTLMYHDGTDTWKFRFTGDLQGEWTFVTASDDADLDGHSGTIRVTENPDPEEPGFASAVGSKWIRTGTGRAFTPQFVMMSGPGAIANNPEFVDEQIALFLDDHGFSGFHVQVYCTWYDLDNSRCNYVNDSNPDSRTFEALEMLIDKVYEAGGIVHFWAWGDLSRWLNPRGGSGWGGLNGPEDQRIQRYIAARLGPLPGWTLGYGFDLDEWVTDEEFHVWHTNMNGWMGWPHVLGGRPAGPNYGTNHSPYVPWNQPVTYSSYEHHRPTYSVYVAALDAVPNQPVFSEDRFRVRDDGRPKDYTMETTRRGLWNSTMAGGVANIWGNLMPPAGDDLSLAYENPEMIKTYATFWENRFLIEFERDNSMTDGVALRDPNNIESVYYDTDVQSLELTLPVLVDWDLVAVDTLLPYAEITIEADDLTVIDAATDRYRWNAPYESDWAVAGDRGDPLAVSLQRVETQAQQSSWALVALVVLGVVTVGVVAFGRNTPATPNTP